MRDGRPASESRSKKIFSKILSRGKTDLTLILLFSSPLLSTSSGTRKIFDESETKKAVEDSNNDGIIVSCFALFLDCYTCFDS